MSEGVVSHLAFKVLHGKSSLSCVKFQMEEVRLIHG